MSDVPSANPPEVAPASVKRPRFRLAYSLGALFCILTAFCLYQAYRTNQQILKYYTPAPSVEYDLEVEPYQFTDADFVHPLDPRPATVQLNERVQVITDRIAELRSRGDGKQADEMQSRLDKILANREGPYRIDGKVQLHAIGIYDGGDPKDGVDPVDGHKIGRSLVRITYTGAPLIVVLCAYDPVHWIVEVDPEVQLQKVIVSGYYRQQVSGLPDGIAVEGQTTGQDRTFTFYADTPIEAQAAAARLKELTSLDATTFYTTHEYAGSPFVIGPGGREWTAAMTLLALDALYQDAVRENRAKLAAALAATPFPDVASNSSGPRARALTYSFAINSIFGPYRQTMRKLNQPTTQFAIDPRGPSFFGFNGQGLVTIDPVSGDLTPWPATGLGARPFGESCLAFDTKRLRLLVWGENLESVDILKKEATLIRKGNPSICALAYSDEDDLLYACCAPYDGDSSNTMITEIRSFNQNGAEISCTKLAVPIPGHDRIFATGLSKVRDLGDALLITSFGGYDGNHYLMPSDTNYVIDPQTGKLLFACKRKPR
jgi:hypothetical protein